MLRSKFFLTIAFVAACGTLSAAAAGRKDFMILGEVGTPVGLGVDVSVFFTKHHNLGVGIGGASLVSAGYNSLHPRYRYYRARSAWTGFWELGAVFGGFESKTTYIRNDLKGGDLGVGLAFIGKGAFTAEFMASVLVAGADREDYARTPSIRESAVWIVPLLGAGLGFAF